MSNHITDLIKLIDDIDKFGQLDRHMPLFAIAIGTMRKDREIASDINVLLESSSSGYGVIALSRIITEDFLHLKYLENSGDDLNKNIDYFNTHPYIDHYASKQSMLNWGYKFSDEEKAIFPGIAQGFEANKDKFLRSGHSHEPYSADSYYRTWTKIGLDKLISKLRLIEGADQKSVHFMNENYNIASTIIHHNAFTIWFLATEGRGTDLARLGYSDIADRATFISLSRIINLIIKILDNEPTIEQDNSTYIQRLEKIMDEFNKSL